MFEDYKKAVLDDYDQKKVAGKLSLEMTLTTPANLKDECIVVCETRYDGKVESLLRSFFGHRDDQTAYRMAIKKHGTTKCKPLSNFLKNRKIATDEKNIELLAWLIDYQPRPHGIWEKNPKAIASMLEDGDKPNERPTEVVKKAPKQVHHKFKRTGLISGLFVLIALAGLSIYILWPKPPAFKTGGSVYKYPPLKGKCMYWAGDHYVPGQCNLLHHDTPNVALDTGKMNYFKKISDWSALNKNSVKKVWYAKINGHLEIYSSEGMHPVDTNKRLLPLTDYMYKKYIHPNE